MIRFLLLWLTGCDDEGAYASETPEQRWARMRKWVAANIAADREEEP